MKLQEVVDELAQVLERSVVINDAEYRPVAASAQGNDIDRIRAESLLRRSTPDAARRYLEGLSVDDLRYPTTVDLSGFDARERLAVPIRSDDRLYGVLWLITGGLPALTESDLAAVDVAVDSALPMLFSDSVSPDDSYGRERSDGYLMRLLSDDVAVRRQAFTEALGRHALVRGPDTVIRAVLVDGQENSIALNVFGRCLDRPRDSSVRFLGLCGDCLIFVSHAHDSAVLEEKIRTESADRVFTIRSIGSAAHQHDDDDLRVVADRAVTAAKTAAVLPEFGARADYSELGSWILLQAVGGDRSLLSSFSPAAYELWERSDAVQRQTVETYLDCGGHAQVACEQLHIHRTTLYYRLENMPESVRHALDDGLARSTLHVTLKLIRLWEATGRL
jgi:hypothetical protein